MSFNTLQFLKDFGIDYTQEHHHCSEERVNIHCPFCNDTNYKLGLLLDSGHGNCWACGYHHLRDIMTILLRKEQNTIYQLMAQYRTTHVYDAHRHLKKEPIKSKICKLPNGAESFDKWHFEYLNRRGFRPLDILQLEKLWQLKGTNYLGDYKFRIIIPNYQKGILVNYQGRDITGKSKLRYLDCPGEEEVISCRHTLYGLDKVSRNKIVVTEGPADVWRLGPGAVHTFGINWTREQVNQLLNFDVVYIWYDNQPQAQKQALKLAESIGLHTNVIIVDLDLLSRLGAKDPAELKQHVADDIMRELMEE